MNVITNSPNTEQLYKLYLSSAFGAFCVGFGDLLNNDKAATVLKISEVIRRNLYASLESGPLIALVALALIGGIVCWIHQPQTRVDAFARGFSVFAVLAVAAPYQPAPDGLINHPGETQKIGFLLFGLSDAYAESDTTTSANNTDQEQAASVTVKITPVDSNQNISNAVVTIRELDTGKIVGEESTKTNMVSISQPTGQYLIEIESPDFRRSSSELNIEGKSEAFSLSIERSKVPLSIQRLYATDKVELRSLNE